MGDEYQEYRPRRRRRSPLRGALMRALVGFVVVFVVYGLLFAGGDDPADDRQVGQTSFPTFDPVLPTEPTSPPQTTPTAPATTPPPTTPPATPVPNGITVQVLSGSDDQRTAAAVDLLQQLGYDVTETGVARRTYTETTVFATAGHEEEAQALVDADPRFAVFGDNPGTVTDTIDLHVVVGEDWPLDGPDDAAGTTGEVPPPPEPSPTTS